MDKYDFAGIANHFRFSGAFRGASRYNSQTNENYLLECEGGRYVLQHLNTEAYRAPEDSTANIALVCAHMTEAGATGTPRLVETRKGGVLLREVGGYWRAFNYIEGSTVPEREAASDGGCVYAYGRTLGRFHRILTGFPVSSLRPILAASRDIAGLPARLEEAAEEDVERRHSGVEAELAAAVELGEEAGLLEYLLASGDLPTRATHNNPRPDNALVDVETGEPLCLTGLDRLAPGTLLYDFGEGVRYCVDLCEHNCGEDFSIEAFDAFARGFLEEMTVTPAELALMPVAPRIMAYAAAAPMLTEYLNGEIDEDGLAGARQFLAMARAMRTMEGEMRRVAGRWYIG